LNTLTRTTVQESTNSNALVNFSAGTKDVAMVLPGGISSHNENNIEETLASAGTTNLGSVGTKRVAISGTTTITSFGTTPHLVKFLRFTGAMTLTHNATTLILPGAANILTVAGDTAIALSDASGNWRIWHYVRSSFVPNSGFASGTKMPFNQTSAPTYWTKDTTHNDKAMRIVNGTVGSGGTAAFSTVFGSTRTTTDSHTLTTAEMPSHAHGAGSFSAADHRHNAYIRDPQHSHTGTVTLIGQAGSSAGSGTFPGLFPTNNSNTTSGATVSINNNSTGVRVNDGSGGSGVDDQTALSGALAVSGTSGNNGSDGGHTHPLEMRLQFVDFIVATKD
jgi:hypothetical protein